jgi:hypothetical protein
MEKTAQHNELSPLSASKIKTLENCSWLYWCNYHLKLPQSKNEGSQKGEVCHWLFETLLNQKHQTKVAKIIKEGSTTAVPSIHRLMKLYIRKAGLPNTQTILLHIDQMVLVGLRNDFYVKGGKLLAPEYKFDIIKPAFRIKGFMDKPSLKGKTVLIEDYKSSKMKFKGEDEESNMQALMYSYAARQIWPSYQPVVRFIFLQYPDDPIMDVSFTDDALAGFELYLEDIQKRVNMFNENSAKSAFAADIKPHDDGFNGSLLCGFAKRPDELKKDGTKKWHCAYRFGFDYWVVKKDGKIVSSSKEEIDLKNLKKGETVEKMHYDGCPKHRSPLDFIKKAPTKGNTKFANVLDDF